MNDNDETSGKSFSYLTIDATPGLVRGNGRIREGAALMVVEIDTDGYRGSLVHIQRHLSLSPPG
ncbi:MAG: hypothetical protein ACLFVS_05335 [Candidatus Acetothermia bacterium]